MYQSLVFISLRNSTWEGVKGSIGMKQSCWSWYLFHARSRHQHSSLWQWLEDCPKFSLNQNPSCLRDGARKTARNDLHLLFCPLDLDHEYVLVSLVNWTMPYRYVKGISKLKLKCTQNFSKVCIYCCKNKLQTSWRDSGWGFILLSETDCLRQQERKLFRWAYVKLNWQIAWIIRIPKNVWMDKYRV